MYSIFVDATNDAINTPNCHINYHLNIFKLMLYR